VYFLQGDRVKEIVLFSLDQDAWARAAACLLLIQVRSPLTAPSGLRFMVSDKLATGFQAGRACKPLAHGMPPFPRHLLQQMLRVSCCGFFR